VLDAIWMSAMGILLQFAMETKEFIAALVPVRSPGVMVQNF
jgi:hypothetical protein